MAEQQPWRVSCCWCDAEAVTDVTGPLGQREPACAYHAQALARPGNLTLDDMRAERRIAERGMARAERERLLRLRPSWLREELSDGAAVEAAQRTVGSRLLWFAVVSAAGALVAASLLH